MTDAMLQDALLRISQYGYFRVQCCDDVSRFPGDCNAELRYNSETECFTLVSKTDRLKQNIIRAAAEIEQEMLLRIVGRPEWIDTPPLP
jgi:hypothetical protein